MIQCPFCYERISESVDTCQSHCEEFHPDKINELITTDFTLADYWREEGAFFKLKNLLKGSIDDSAKVEELVEQELVGAPALRKRLLTLRLQVCLWPCTHECDDPDNLDDCCDARRRFGEFMNVMCDAYGSNSDSE